jgi:hypothetical protein
MRSITVFRKYALGLLNSARRKSSVFRILTEQSRFALVAADIPLVDFYCQEFFLNDMLTI